VSAPLDLPAVLRDLADLSDIRGAVLEADDLRRAAESIASLGPEGSARIARLVQRDRLDDALIPSYAGWRVREIVSTGAATALEQARRSLPLLLRQLLDLGTVTPSQARRLARDLDVLTLADLEREIDLLRNAGILGPGTERALAASATALAPGARPLVLGRALDILEPMLTALAAATPQTAVEPAGDVRRCEPFVADLSLVATSPEPEPVLEIVCGLAEIDAILHRGRRRCIVSCRDAEIDVRVTPPETYGTVLFLATGTAAHVKAVRQRRSHLDPCPTEADVYVRAGLAFTAPELRQAAGEIEAAAANALPRLVTRDDIRGDLHMHSTYSDGRDTLEAMVRTCATIGYEYIAITDHSERAAAVRTLRADDIERQRDEIDRLREQFPLMQILHGVEVDVLADGRLDFSDAILARFDIVLASLHERLGHDGAQLTARCLAALRHPLVAVLTHPQNRIPGQRGDYPLDFDAVYATAAETGTALEVDGSPGHLDLDGEHARAAIRAGVTLVIDSDCHRARSLERQMRMGVGLARRGWVEPRHVLNTGTVEAVRAFIAAKRQGRA
jgi:DNA polymerase (family 10)